VFVAVRSFFFLFSCYYGALIYFFTFLISLGCFFGPMFIKRGGDLEALQARNKRRIGQGHRSYEPDQM